MKVRRPPCVLPSTTAVGLAVLTALSSAAASAEGLEEVVVTAQRRQQSMQDVGVSVSAASGDELRNLGAVNQKDIANIFPGVTLDGGSSGDASGQLGIRGVVQSDYSVNQEGPNSMYIDEVYLSSSGLQAFPIYDLERVEVLRGPQGTLFGRASSGGLVSFFTKRPTDKLEGYADVRYGSFNSISVEGAISGPFSDRVRGRLSGLYSKADGWWENKNNSQPGQADTMETNFRGVRGQLEMDVTDSLTARLSIAYDEHPRYRLGTYNVKAAYVLENGDDAYLPADMENPMFPGAGPGNDAYGYRDPYKDKTTSAFNSLGYEKNHRFTPTLYLTWTTDSFTFDSVTSYMEFKSDYKEDCDGDPYEFCWYPITQDMEQWSQEFRLNGTAGGLTWTAGAYWLSTDQTFSQSYQSLYGMNSDYAFWDYNPGKQKMDSYAVFGQLEYMFNDKLRGIVGARYTHDKKTFNSQVYYNELGCNYIDPGLCPGSVTFDPALLGYDFSRATVGSLAETNNDMVSGKVELDYIPSADSLVYVSIARGVKGAGFNTNTGATLTYEQTPFGPESLLAYEVGAKTTSLSDRLRVNASLFYYDYHDFQTWQFINLAGYVTNNDATFSGAELEISAAPTDGLILGLGVACLFDRTVKDVSTLLRGVRDQDASNAPPLSVTGNVTYGWTVGSGRLAVTWDGNYLDDRYASADNTFGNKIYSSFVNNARLSYDLPDSGWEFAAFVTNIGDTARQTFAFDQAASLGNLLRSYAAPRQFGVSVRKSF